MTRTRLYRIYVPLTNVVNQFIIPLLKEFGPLAFALSLTIYLDVGFFETFMFALKVLILSLSLNMLYGWVYIANEFVTKYEPPELRTIRFGEAVTIMDVISVSCKNPYVSTIVIVKR